jgi:hypothetical protein
VHPSSVNCEVRRGRLVADEATGRPKGPGPDWLVFRDMVASAPASAAAPSAPMLRGTHAVDAAAVLLFTGSRLSTAAEMAEREAEQGGGGGGGRAGPWAALAGSDAATGALDGWVLCRSGPESHRGAGRFSRAQSPGGGTGDLELLAALRREFFDIVLPKRLRLGAGSNARPGHGRHASKEAAEAAAHADAVASALVRVLHESSSASSASSPLSLFSPISSFSRTRFGGAGGSGEWFGTDHAPRWGKGFQGEGREGAEFMGRGRHDAAPAWASRQRLSGSDRGSDPNRSASPWGKRGGATPAGSALAPQQLTGRWARLAQFREGVEGGDDDTAPSAKKLSDSAPRFGLWSGFKK